MSYLGAEAVYIARKGYIGAGGLAKPVYEVAAATLGAKPVQVVSEGTLGAKPVYVVWEGYLGEEGPAQPVYVVSGSLG